MRDVAFRLHAGSIVIREGRNVGLRSHRETENGRRRQNRLLITSCRSQPHGRRGDAFARRRQGADHSPCPCCPDASRQHDAESNRQDAEARAVQARAKQAACSKAPGRDTARRDASAGRASSDERSWPPGASTPRPRRQDEAAADVAARQSGEDARLRRGVGWVEASHEGWRPDLARLRDQVSHSLILKGFQYRLAVVRHEKKTPGARFATQLRAI